MDVDEPLDDRIRQPLLDRFLQALRREPHAGGQRAIAFRQQRHPQRRVALDHRPHQGRDLARLSKRLELLQAGRVGREERHQVQVVLGGATAACMNCPTITRR
jgi:hypothetical protein